MGPLPPAIAFLSGSAGQFTVAFDTSGTFGGKGATVLALTSKQASAQHLFLVVDPATSLVTESVVVESTGDTDDYRFTNTNTTSAIKASVFAFDPKSEPTYKVQVIAPPAAPAKPPAAKP
jgi:outer membrane lipoprotein-sorting protein